MTKRQIKQRRVRASITAIKHWETKMAVAKNGGPITENQLNLVRLHKMHKRAEYERTKSPNFKASLKLVKELNET